MDIYEIAKKTRISLSALRRLERFGVLAINKPNNPEFEKAKANLRKGQRMSVLQTLMFAKDPALIDSLTMQQSQRCKEQLRLLGNLNGQWPMLDAATIDIASRRAGNSQNDDERREAQKEVATWMQGLIPSKPVEHHFLAIRALWHCPETMHDHLANKIALAFLNARDQLPGWWHINAKKRTIYQRQESFDL